MDVLLQEAENLTIEKYFEKSFINIWWICKRLLPLQRQNKTRHIKRCAGGGTGRRVCLRGISEFYWVQVQVLSGAQKILKITSDFQDFSFMDGLS